VDFFTPIVDDPVAYGQIAAANALSDVYAMGGRPLVAMNLVGIPPDKLRPETVAGILRGGAAKVAEAGGLVVGGHTIQNPEPVYGLAVTGMVALDRYLTNARAQPGDQLVLTKPLGTGIVTTAVKRGIAPAGLEDRAVESMCRLNDVGAVLAERGLVRAATDVTGFGLSGHLAALCRASGVSAVVAAGRLPVLDGAVLELIDADCVPGGSRANREAADQCVRWDPRVAPRLQMLAADAQTSGGLLLCVRPEQLDQVMQVLAGHRTLCAAQIGGILPPAGESEPIITVTP
jgi:selenide,water dikinase